MLFSFEHLNVYQDSMTLVSEVYRMTNSFPTHERFALSQQLQRAIVSVPSNIAEGCGRRSLKEKAHFMEIAAGSLMESYCQLQIARRLEYITDQQLTNLKRTIFSVAHQLEALRKSFCAP